MKWFEEFSTLLEAVGASGVATLIASMLTGRKSGVKKQIEAEAEADDRREHLEDEIVWLRQQLAVKKSRGE